MNIEQLKTGDLFQYKSLIDECFGHSNPIIDYNKYDPQAPYTIWVIKDKETIIGSITQYPIELFTFSFHPCLMLFNVAVKEEYRKQRIAQALLEEIIQTARVDGYRSINLTCLEDAFPAHYLYESVGFKKTDSRKYSLDLEST